MAFCRNIVSVYLLAILLIVQSQLYPNSDQHSYQSYQGYLGYPPYPYYYSQSYQSYQPHVSNFPGNYYPYVYPGQNFAPYNIPQHNQPYQSYYPLSPTSATQSSSSYSGKQADPYANIKTDIIDVDPKHFQYYKRFFNLDDNLYPTQVEEDSDVVRKPSYSPTYTVKTNSRHSNYTNNPLSIHKHEVQTKSFSYKKTFTLDPNKKEDKVINLNFVNGVQVTETPEEEAAIGTVAATK